MLKYKYHEMKQYVPQYILEQLESIMDSTDENGFPIYDYSDNPRASLIGNLLSEHLFRRSESKGCCGKFETIIESNSKQYRIGFNYGH